MQTICLCQIVDKFHFFSIFSRCNNNVCNLSTNIDVTMKTLQSVNAITSQERDERRISVCMMLRKSHVADALSYC